MNLVNSKAGVFSIIATVVGFLSTIAPLIPSPWGALVTAVLGILAFYHINVAVGSARASGVRGI